MKTKEESWKAAVSCPVWKKCSVKCFPSGPLCNFKLFICYVSTLTWQWVGMFVHIDPCPFWVCSVKKISIFILRHVCFLMVYQRQSDILVICLASLHENCYLIFTGLEKKYNLPQTPGAVIRRLLAQALQKATCFNSFQKPSEVSMALRSWSRDFVLFSFLNSAQNHCSLSMAWLDLVI